jgi:hypothetical protein
MQLILDFGLVGDGFRISWSGGRVILDFGLVGPQSTIGNPTSKISTGLRRPVVMRKHELNPKSKIHNPKWVRSLETE